MGDVDLLRKNREDIQRRYLLGESQLSIANDYGVNSGTLYYVLEEWGIDGKGGQAPSRYDLDVEAIVERYRKGESMSSIADDLGVSKDPIRRRLREEEVKLRPLSEQISLARTTEYDFSNGVLDAIRGELLGDGSLVKGDGNVKIDTYCFGLSTTTRGHAEFVKSLLPDGMIPNTQPYESTFDDPNRQPMYGVRTNICPTFTEMESRWYTDRNKEVPQDLGLTHTALRHWYWGDGCLWGNGYGYQQAGLSTVGFSEEGVLHLVDELNRLGYEARLGQDSREYDGAGMYIRLTRDSTRKMLAELDNPVEGYDYKWDFNESSAL